MKVAIGADHGGVHLKAAIKALLDELNLAYTDLVPIRKHPWITRILPNLWLKQ